MTTLIAFSPSASTSPPFSTTVTLDGASYALTVMWNFYRSDWYMQVTDQSGTLIVNRPLVGSPSNNAYNDINLAGGYFTTSTLVYRSDTGNFEQTP